MVEFHGFSWMKTWGARADAVGESKKELRTDATHRRMALTSDLH
jgi:hypothetical protein